MTVIVVLLLLSITAADSHSSYGGSYKSSYSKSGYGSNVGQKWNSGYKSNNDYHKFSSSKEKSAYNSKEKSVYNSKDKSAYNLKGRYNWKSANSGGYKYNSRSGYNSKDTLSNFAKGLSKPSSDKALKELYFSSAPGHCKPICPCYMNGISYDHGDRWQSKEDPCTTYRCGNGFYEAIVRGIMFKGQCKNVGTIWTEGCFTYQVRLIGNTPMYRLKEGGCKDEEGNCWRVGDQFKKNCNTYECQIVGTCYTISLISKGCAFDGECKEVNKFWHDGCAIYQCMDHSGKAEEVHNEIMYWPEGDYGLLKSKTGCPVDVAEEWSEGHRGHVGSLKNYVSFDFDAFGMYSSFVFIHYFCMKREVNDSSIRPRYQTYWETGKYCIMRKNGTCPKGFQEGYITMDDVDKFENLSTTNGSLPDGSYKKDTTFYFCCRNDGDTEVPLVLPKERPFILFMGSKADDCQQVRGMTHTLEYFAFDDDDNNPMPVMNGSIPMTKDGDNSTEIYFCHYKPMDCGCDDGDGNTVLVGDKIKKGCSWFTCKEEQGLRVLTVISGGCKDDKGNCRNESEVWMASYGETCYSKRCYKIDNGVKVEFQIKTDYRGCKDEDMCRPLNYHIQRGCYNSVCTASQSSQDCRFRMVKAGCSDGKGKCIPIGSEFTKNCMTYKCSAATTKCGMKFLRGACKYDGECHAVNAVWHHAACHWLKCTMTRKANSISFNIDSVEQECNYKGKCYKAGDKVKEGCSSKQCVIDKEKKVAYMSTVAGACVYNGKCYKAGDKVTEGCNTKQCFYDKEKRATYMNIVDGGCKFNGRCIGVNMTWNSGCTEYTCRWYKNGLRHVFKQEVKQQKCSFKNECVEEGTRRKHGCVDYECSIKTTDKAQYASMNPVSYACKDKSGNCLATNEEIEEDCSLYRCEGQANSKFPQLERVGGGCKVNGVCKDENSVWTDESSCVDYKCEREKRSGNTIYMVQRPVKVGCRHDGICRYNGEKWPLASRPCFQVECTVTKTPGSSYGFKRLLSTSPSGCVVNGICREYGYTNYVGCIQYKCQWDELRRMATYRYAKGGCKEYTTSNCHDVGAEWTETYGKTTCLKMKCKKSGNSFTYDVGYLCQDADGYCVNPGQKFEALGYNGQRRKNCYCKQTGSHVSTVCTASHNY
ncbi:uncharacterized protein [Mytilus edulis]|uniref:uncharacterized protein n=1 Tax=Mytilus edulis TaxID=6550 RepID=UPI0039F01247